MKRTTLILEDSVLEAVRDTAHRRGTDMSKVVNEWLSNGWQRERQEVLSPSPLPIFSMGKPAINLADRDQLEMLMEPR
jgi:hypothetical protein